MTEFGEGRKRRTVRLSRPARGRGRAFSAIETHVIADDGAFIDIELELGTCGSCGAAFHSETEVMGRCAFCPAILCKACSERRCAVCQRPVCLGCARRVGEQILCDRDLVRRGARAVLVLVGILPLVAAALVVMATRL
jgi:hypothetical protein